MLIKPELSENGLCCVVSKSTASWVLASLLYIHECTANVLVAICKLSLPKVNGVCHGSSVPLMNVDSC